MGWRCGVSRGRVRTLVAMARRLADLPRTKAALDGGDLAEGQVAVADFARYATVSQLRRVLVDYTWAPQAEGPQAKPEERRRVSFGHRDALVASAQLHLGPHLPVPAPLPGLRRQRTSGDRPPRRGQPAWAGPCAPFPMDAVPRAHADLTPCFVG